MTRAAIGTRSDYRAFVPLQTRWADNDSYGHLNNAAYFSLIDTAVSRWQMSQGLVISGPDALSFLVVENGCRYHAELAFPDALDAGLRIAHIGRSSFRTEVGLFRQGQDGASAEGFFAQVLVGADGQPTPLDAQTRATFERLV